MAGVEVPPSIEKVNVVVDRPNVVTVFTPLYADGVAPAIVTVSPFLRPCAAAVVAVAVPPDCDIELTDAVVLTEVAAAEIVMVPLLLVPITCIKLIK